MNQYRCISNVWEVPFAQSSKKDKREFVSFLLEKESDRHFDKIEQTVLDMIRSIQIENAIKTGDVKFQINEETIFYSKFAYLFGFLSGRKVVKDMARKRLEEIF